MFREIGARERTRTSTTLRSLAPEASASASSATRAQVRVHRFAVTPEMLTPAQPESHIQRSIFILPGSSPFLHAKGGPPEPDGRPLGDVSGKIPRYSTTPEPPDAWPTKATHFSN